MPRLLPRAAASRCLPAFLATLISLPLRAQTTVALGAGQVNATAYDTSAPDSPLTFTVDSGSATQSGLLSGTGAIVKDGAGTLTLTTSNTYTGGTTLDAGTLGLGADDALGTGTLTIYGGTLRAVDAGRTLTNAVILAGDFTLGRFTNLAGAITLAADLTITASNPDSLGSLTTSILSGVISGAHGLTFAETTGTFTPIILAGANTYTGDTVLDSGYLTLAHSLALQNSTFNYQYGTFSFGTLSSATFGGLAGRNDLTLGYNSTDAVALTVGGNNASTTYTGFLSGSGSLTKVGSGTLTLTGYNTYSGGTTVSAGTLQIGNGSTSGTSINGNIVNNASLVFNLASSLPYSDIISGTGTVTKDGGGRLTLWGANTYTGDTLLLGGELKLANSLALQNSTVDLRGGALTFTALGQVSLGGLAGTQSLGLADSFGNAIALTVGNNHASTTYAGILSGIGSLIKIGTGTLALTGANTYTGSTTLSGGTLALSGSGALSTGALFLTGGATLDLGGTSQTLASLGSGSSRIVGDITAGTITTTGNTYLERGTFAATFAGSSANGRLWIGGDTAATVYLNGTNDAVYTADHNEVIIGHATTGAAGTVQLGNANALAAATENVEVWSGTLDLNGQAGVRANSIVLQSGPSSALVNNSASAASYAGGVTLATGSAQLGGAGDLTLSGRVAGAGGFTKIGAGTLTLSGANTYAGDTAVSAGTLLLGSVTALGGGPAMDVSSGATLDLAGHSVSLVSLTGAGRVTLGSATLTVGSSNTTTTFGGVISGSGALVKTGSGTFTLTGANTYSGGTTFSAGTVAIATAEALGSGASTFDGGTLANTAALTLASAVTLGSGGATFATTGGDLTLSGVVSGVGSLTKTGGATLIFTGANTYSGHTTVSAGTLQIGDGGISGGIVGDITDNAALVFNRSDALTYSGNISGTGSFTQSGSGTLTLAGANTYSGATTVSAGTLALGSATALGGNTAVSVASGATLDLAGHATTLASLAGAGDVALGAATLTTGGANISTTFSGVISGGGALVKTGSGTFTLTGANTYSGGTTISSGTLTLGDGGTLGDGNLVDNAALVIARSTALTLAHPISGTGTLTVSGSGTLTLAAANTFSGTTTLASGTLSLGHSLALQQSTLNLTGGSLNFGSLTAATFGGLAGTQSFALTNASAGAVALTIGTNNVSTTYAGVLSGAGSLIKTGTGTLTLSGASTYSGGTTVDAGFVTFSSLANFGTGALTLDGGGLRWASGSTADASALGLVVDSGGGTLDTNGNDVTLASALSGSGSLIKTGTGTLTLSDANTYSGGTTVGAGSIAFSSLASFGSGPIALDGGGLRWTSGNTTDISTRLTALGSGGATFDTNGNSVTFASALSGSGALTKSGAGTLTLSGANTYSGGTVLADGTLAIASADALGSGPLIFNGGSLATSGALTLSSAISLNRSVAFSTAGGDLTLAGAISGLGSLTKTDAGTLTLSGANTFTGDTTVSGGTLALSGAGKIGLGTLGLTAGATLDLGGGTQTIAGAGGFSTGLVGHITAGTISTPGYVFIQSGTFDNTWTGSSADSYLFIGGDASATILLNGANNATNTYDPTQVVIGYFSAAGTVKLGNADALAADSENVEIYDGTLDLNGQTGVRANSLALKSGSASGLVNSFTTSTASFAGGVTLSSAGSQIGGEGNLTLSGALSGSGGFSKIGTGTLTLTGANTYTGATAVSAGKLVVNGSAAGSAFTINSGATLGGSGTVGTLTVASGGILAPGNSPGTLTAGNTTFAGGATFQFQLNDASGSAGTAWDLLAVNGTLTLNATSDNPFTLDLTSLTSADVAGDAANFHSAADYSFTFLTTTDGVSGFSSDAFTIDTSHFTNPFTGTWSVSLTNSGHDLTLNYTGASAIPEPSTYAALAGLAALGLAFWRRRRLAT